MEAENEKGANEQLHDEIQWSDAWHAQHQLGGIHDNTVLFYFQNSPYFEWTSNNGTLYTQAMNNPQLMPVLYTRQVFEARLKTMSGVEYLVAQEPAETAPGTGTGVWVIRKQNRKKVPGREDDVEVLATYFLVGLNIYMAPAVGDIISGRMLSVAHSLKKFVETTSSIAKFTPASGHAYYQPKAKSKTAQGSGAASPIPIDAVIPTATATATATAKITSSPTSPTDTSIDAHLLSQSIDLSFRFGEVYMDENPITGHPGEFHFSSTGRVEKERQLAVPPTTKQPFASQTLPGKKADGQPALGLKTKDLPGQISRKGSKAEKSPRTPGGAKIKRRKSKVSTAVSTPQATSPI